MASNTFAPFSTSPLNYIQGAQNPATAQPGRAPVSANQLTPGMNLNLSPGHAQLLNQLQGSQQSNSIPSLMQQIINNPTLAKQMAGSTSTPYTPPQPANAWRANFQAPANVNGTSGWGNGMIGDNISLFGNGTPNSPTPASPMQMGAAPAVIDPSSQNAAYQQWLQQQSTQNPYANLSTGN